MTAQLFTARQNASNNAVLARIRVWVSKSVYSEVVSMLNSEGEQKAAAHAAAHLGLMDIPAVYGVYAEYFLTGEPITEAGTEKIIADYYAEQGVEDPAKTLFSASDAAPVAEVAEPVQIVAPAPAKRLKVYSWVSAEYGTGPVLVIMAATSKAEVLRIMNRTRLYLLDETKADGAYAAALANPGVALYGSVDGNPTADCFKPAEPTPAPVVEVSGDDNEDAIECEQDAIDAAQDAATAEPARLAEGMAVIVVDGYYKGRTGTLTDLANADALVRLDGNDGPKMPEDRLPFTTAQLEPVAAASLPVGQKTGEFLAELMAHRPTCTEVVCAAFDATGEVVFSKSSAEWHGAYSAFFNSGNLDTLSGEQAARVVSVGLIAQATLADGTKRAAAPEIVGFLLEQFQRATAARVAAYQELQRAVSAFCALPDDDNVEWIDNAALAYKETYWTLPTRSL